MNNTLGVCKKCSIKNRVLRQTTHGKTNTKLFNTWQNMKARCCNENNKNYSRYGGRGISVCKEWNEFVPFMDWSNNNGYEEGLSIDRVDVNGNYEPSNCQWITRSENSSKDLIGKRQSQAHIDRAAKTKTKWNKEFISKVQEDIDSGLRTEDACLKHNISKWSFYSARRHNKF